MKVIQGIASLLTIVAASVSCYKVFEEGNYDSVAYLSLAFNFMLFAVITQVFNNGKNSN